ncbi:UNVERIFIED_CONTAM: hypothetical protein FKN15_028525 [Acipenser sinensis]
MDSVKMESVQIKEEFLELVPIRVEFSWLASLPIKQELCEMQCDSSQAEVSEIKAEHNELEIPQTEEPLPVKQEEVLETVRIKQEPPEVEFDHMEPVKEESEDFKPNIPELEPVRLRECSVVLERICVRQQGAGEEGSPNSMQGGGKEDGRSHSECSLAGSCFAWGRQGSCCAWGHYNMAGAPRRGAACHEERGGGQETSSPSRTFAAGDRVAGAPEEGATGHKELGGVGPTTMATPMDTVLPPLPGL